MTSARIAELAADREWRSCPFCGEDDFDWMGLAHHVYLGCDVVRELADMNAEAVREMYRRDIERAEQRAHAKITEESNR